MRKSEKVVNKLAYYTNKLGELVLVDVLFLITCIPVVTFIPASSAMHYVLLRILHDKENGVAKEFFKSFRENLKQGVVLSLLYLCLFCGQGAFVYIILQSKNAFKMVLFILAVILLLLTSISLQWVCIMLSRYESKTFRTVKNAITIAVGKPLTSLLIVLISIAPFLGILLLPRLLPIMLFLGFSLCGLLQTILYQKVFSLIEKKESAVLLEEK